MMKKNLETSIIAVVAIVAVAMFAGCIEEENAKELKSKVSVDRYDDLMRYNNECVGEIMYCIGPVVQVMELTEESSVLRVHMTPQNGTRVNNSLGVAWKDAIWVNYEGIGLSEEDLVGIFGEVKGLKTYESIRGTEITIPEVDALHVELIAEAGEEWWENEEIRKKLQAHWKRRGIEDTWISSYV